MVIPGSGIIIQARYNSARLPGKITLPLPYHSELTVLDQIIGIGRAIKPVEHVIVATSFNHENDILHPISSRNGASFFRGDENDVLARFFGAASLYNLKYIIRFTGDNPFIDPELAAETLANHLQTGADYTSTVDLPLGTNLEIFNYRALETTYREAILPAEREHVTPFIRNHPDRFRINVFRPSLSFEVGPAWRLTVDNANDYALACILYQELYQDGHPITLREVCQFLQDRPYLSLINQENFQKKVFPNLRAELETGVNLLKQNDLPRAADRLANLITG